VQPKKRLTGIDRITVLGEPFDDVASMWRLHRQ
jgi:hypothetical protein